MSFFSSPEVIAVYWAIVLLLIALLVSAVLVALHLVRKSTDHIPDEKVYDSVPLTYPKFKITTGSLAETDTIVHSFTGSQLNVGESENLFTIRLRSSNGTSKTSNYTITYVYGKLKVTPCAITITSLNAEKIYDSTPLTYHEVKVIKGKLGENDRIVANFTGSQLYVGQSENTFTAEIKAKNGNEQHTSNYIITYAYGKLKITPCPITITSESKEKEYDGTPLTHHKVNVTQGSLLANHQLRLSFTSSQTEIGESDNTFSAIIVDENGNDVTRYYEITCQFGKLKVVENPAPIPPELNQGNGSGDGSGNGDGDGDGDGDGNGSGPGDGGNHDDLSESGTNITVPPTSDSGSKIPVATIRPDGTFTDRYYFYLREHSYGNYDGKGFLPAPKYTRSFISPLDFVGYNAKKYGISKGTVRVILSKGSPILVPYFSYNSTTLFGNTDTYFKSDETNYLCNIYQFEDLKELLKLVGTNAVSQYETAYRKFVYNQYLQIPASMKTKLLNLSQENGVQQSDDLYTMITQIQKYIRSAAKIDPNGKAYPDNVDQIIYFLTVAKKGGAPHFAAAATMLFRAYGIPARYTVGYVANTSPHNQTTIYSEDAHAWVEVYIDGIGWIPVEVTPGISTSIGKKQVTVAPYSASKIYDGLPFSKWNKQNYNILEGSLFPGHTIKVTIKEEDANATNAGTYINTITKVVIYDENGKDVTKELYDVKLQTGTRTILQRQIFIRTDSASKVFDGTPLTCNTWSLIGHLLEMDELRVIFPEGITKPSAISNKPAEISVLHKNANGKYIDVTNNYEITVVPGKLVITSE